MFGRLFGIFAAVLLFGMLLLGSSFRAILKGYLGDQKETSLRSTAQAVADLTAAYQSAGVISGENAWQLRMELSLSAEISGADAYICDSQGTILICSQDGFSCDHVGLTVDPSYLTAVAENGYYCETGLVPGLYEDQRYVVALVWAVIPVCNTLVFLRTPMPPILDQGEKGLGLRELFRMKSFWLMMLMMTCAGASEQAVSQWASTFAEEGLGVSKALGDLAGPMSFALLMGTARLLYGKLGHKLDLDRCMAASCGLCVLSYLVIALIPQPALGLAGCGLCGFAVGILWPGTFSRASAAIPAGGTALFAMLALAGDVGCAAGPTIAGFVSSAAGDDLRAGILGAIGFPILLLLGVALTRKKKKLA